MRQEKNNQVTYQQRKVIISKQNSAQSEKL